MASDDTERFITCTRFRELVTSPSMIPADLRQTVDEHGQACKDCDRFMDDELRKLNKAASPLPSPPPQKSLSSWRDSSDTHWDACI